MAFASVGSAGYEATYHSANKTSGTTFAVDDSRPTLEVGNLVVLVTAWDNTDTTSGQSTRLSVADDAGNTWTKAYEYTLADGAAADGVTLAVFYTVVTAEIATSDAVTVTSDTARVAKGATMWEFTLADPVAVEQVDVTAVKEAGPPTAATISGLPSREYLLVHALVSERSASTTESYDSDYTAWNKSGCTGAATDTNVIVLAEHRIATLTGDTAAFSYSSSVDTETCQFIVAFYEDTGAASLPPIRNRSQLAALVR